MFENLAYIIVITAHPGRHPNNGGEYGYLYRLYPAEPGVWEKEYRTSAEMKREYCPVHGVWQNCPERFRDDSERHECGAMIETVTTAEIKDLADQFPSGVDADEDGNQCGIIDITGHEHTPGPQGGCVECYPY